MCAAFEGKSFQIDKSPTPLVLIKRIESEMETPHVGPQEP